MAYTRARGRILKEGAKKLRVRAGDEYHRHITAVGSDHPVRAGHVMMKWVTLLQTRLTDCPTDALTQCALASLLEELGQPEEALCQWNAVLVCDPDSLKDRAGVVRCRQRIG